jgi:drug/metabolite transporter (DMT)-like permease
MIIVWIALIFLGNGLAQFFQASLHLDGLDLFLPNALLLMYLAGGIFAAVGLATFHGRLGRQEWFFGAVVGIASYAGNLSVLQALRTVPARTAFPFVVAGPIVVVAIYARLVQGVKLTPRKSIGIVLAVTAIALFTNS